MAKNIVWCKTLDGAKGYKYVAVIYESNSAYGKFYVSNNLSDLKSFVYNDVKRSFDTARGNIYYQSDEYFSRPIYMCCRDNRKTFSQDLLNWW